MTRKIMTFIVGFILMIAFLAAFWIGYLNGWQLSVLIISLGFFLLIIYNLDIQRIWLTEKRKILAEIKEIQADIHTQRDEIQELIEGIKKDR